ncbi:hypothetical protein [Pseudorhodobacter sp.]|uniref:hypothetical protein n=1 Tax=Pseudorhodobacter sp. TaxID=1934400 RepID=UPI0026490A58|nr:hypothetical protein [Pseudorhodobacter sp.]MDN5785724.1 hypothetical protein [Pseudorhodobacter sp.]
MNVPFHTCIGTIDLMVLRPEDLSAQQLGDALSKINRFGGRSPEPWSVAAHSVLVEALCPPDLQPYALLHDAHKAFLGDLMDPSVELLCRVGTRTAVENAILNAENRIDRAIAAAWGIALRSRSEALLTACQVAFLAEIWVFMDVLPGPVPPAQTDLFDRAIGFLYENPNLIGDWRDAREHWLERISFHASLGHLTPPLDPNPTSMTQAG